MPVERVDTLIIGAGQAGLAMSHMLSRRNRRHLIVERGRVGERWRTERWDGLRFQFPNWSIRLPSFPFRHADPDAFAASDQILAYLNEYADFIAAPIRTGVTVSRLKAAKDAARFIAETSTGTFAADQVVVATGPYQRPYIPNLISQGFDIFQVHSSAYRNADQLPAGAVLIVGSGASGAQIAEELVQAGRRVFLSVGRHRRMPRRYRGKDLIWWLSILGLDQTPVERRGSEKALPLITGARGGHTIDFREFAAQGVVLVGHVTRIHDNVISLAPDLADSLVHGDTAYDSFLDLVDDYVERETLPLPTDAIARAKSKVPSCVSSPHSHIDMTKMNIRSIIWATGYQYDFSWITLPVFDSSGAPIHSSGVTSVPGLYFLGLPWLSKMNSSFLAGVGDDAARLADKIVLMGNEALAH